MRTTNPHRVRCRRTLRESVQEQANSYLPTHADGALYFLFADGFQISSQSAVALCQHVMTSVALGGVDRIIFKCLLTTI